MTRWGCTWCSGWGYGEFSLFFRLYPFSPARNSASTSHPLKFSPFPSRHIIIAEKMTEILPTQRLHHFPPPHDDPFPLVPQKPPRRYHLHDRSVDTLVQRRSLHRHRLRKPASAQETFVPALQPPPLAGEPVPDHRRAGLTDVFCPRGRGGGQQGGRVVGCRGCKGGGGVDGGDAQDDGGRCAEGGGRGWWWVGGRVLLGSRRGVSILMSCIWLDMVFLSRFGGGGAVIWVI